MKNKSKLYIFEKLVMISLKYLLFIPFIHRLTIQLLNYFILILISTYPHPKLKLSTIYYFFFLLLPFSFLSFPPVSFSSLLLSFPFSPPLFYTTILYTIHIPIMQNTNNYFPLCYSTPPPPRSPNLDIEARL